MRQRRAFASVASAAFRRTAFQRASSPLTGATATCNLTTLPLTLTSGCSIGFSCIQACRSAVLSRCYAVSARTTENALQHAHLVSSQHGFHMVDATLPAGPGSDGSDTPCIYTLPSDATTLAEVVRIGQQTPAIVAGEQGGTAFGIVLSGQGHLEQLDPSPYMRPNSTSPGRLNNDANGKGDMFSARVAPPMPLCAGMYFSVPGRVRLSVSSASSQSSDMPTKSGCLHVLVSTSRGLAGLFSLGGPIEPVGRLPYVDGCSDTLLVSPPRWGDACLNLLHFPPETRQTPHTHPSIRSGAVVAGSGICRLADGSTTALHAGMAFMIEAGALHSFETTTESMAVVAYHPDSDFGPKADDHPMVNKTIVNGVSCVHIPDIRTRWDQATDQFSK